VARVVDRITSDTDIVATEARIALAESEIDVYQIAKLMTAGLLGKRRKFVPTKWAITAVDGTISTGLKKEISRFAPREEIRPFNAEIFGNRIVCILVPGDWRYEMVEIWGSHTLWGGDETMIVQDQEVMKKPGIRRYPAHTTLPGSLHANTSRLSGAQHGLSLSGASRRSTGRRLGHG
jgi:hypothetical protein